jgi:hypothetical protein
LPVGIIEIGLRGGRIVSGVEQPTEIEVVTDPLALAKVGKKDEEKSKNPAHCGVILP